MGSRFTWAPAAHKMLNGVFCIFKPSGKAVHRVIQSIQSNLAQDLNALPCYQYEFDLARRRVAENESETSLTSQAEPVSIQDYSEHRLVLGQRYEPDDFEIRFVDGMSSSTSGVLVMGIGEKGHWAMSMIGAAKYLRVYHIKGRFGWCSENFLATGKILQRSGYKHVSRHKLDKVCSLIQGAYTKQMQQLSGVNPDSHEAYMMASTGGVMRPLSRDTSQVLYGVRCIDFQLPDFTLEVHAINESSDMLNRLVHDLALKLKTTAVCSGLRRLRYGYFTTERALAKPEWRLDNIIDNIETNKDLLEPDKLIVDTVGLGVDLLPPRSANPLLSEKGGQSSVTQRSSIDLYFSDSESDYEDGAVCSSGSGGGHQLLEKHKEDDVS